jgi:hypothetical protein
MFCKISMMISFVLFIAYLGLAAGRGVAPSGNEKLLTERNQGEERSSVQDNDQLDTVKVVDKVTKRPLAKTAVRIFRANSIRCITTPCPQNDIEWSGATDAEGIVRVPSDLMIRSRPPGPAATFAAAGHVGLMDVNKDLRRIAKTSWIIALRATPRGKDESLSATNPEEEMPEWLSELIATEKSGPPANPPASMTQYTYRGQIVYYIPSRCCDVPGRLYDRAGTRICNPDGGMTGRGDGQCADFFKERKDEKVLWKDMRDGRK